MTPGEATREFYREQGRQQEQARIIKLLEKNLVEINTVFAKGFDLLENKQHTFGYLKAYEVIIALIKGEN